jgi:hypothetical protein
LAHGGAGRASRRSAMIHVVVAETGGFSIRGCVV